MGLDCTEIILEIEEEFDIFIPDDKAFYFETPQDISNYVFLKIEKTNKCQSQVGFYKLRRILIENFNLKRKDIKPNSKLSTLFKENIPLKWKRLTSLFKYKPYFTLEFSSFTNKIFLTIFFISLTYILISYSISIGILFSLLYFFIYSILESFYGSNIPKKLDKVAYLNKFLDYSNITYKNKDKVLDKIIEIISDHQDIKKSEIKANSALIEYLDC